VSVPGFTPMRDKDKCIFTPKFCEIETTFLYDIYKTDKIVDLKIVVQHANTVQFQECL
jgi:hypothetical protein